MRDITCLEENLFIKTNLLVEGCDIEGSIALPRNFQEKKIHLYAHSTFKNDTPIPDDIILPHKTTPFISRIRLNKNASLKLSSQGDKYFLLHESGAHIPVEFVPRFDTSNLPINESNTLSEVCSFLGNDLIGVVPSNYCFYFKNSNECRFCEIWPTYRKEVDYLKPIKTAEVIKKSVSLALEQEPRVKYLAITSGNVKSYDFTAKLFVKIGRSLKEMFSFNRLHEVLATLMPPDDLNLIKEIKDSGINKIYFPLEVFEKELFKIICPGKYTYGYDKLIDALEFAVDVFGVGNVYTNFVYGIQSLSPSLNANSYQPELENERSLVAVEKMLERKIIPVFTIYHYSGYNSIGNIRLSAEHTFHFFKEMGEKIFNSGLIPENSSSIIFSTSSLSNTAYNESFLLAKLKGGQL